MRINQTIFDVSRCFVTDIDVNDRTVKVILQDKFHEIFDTFLTPYQRLQSHIIKNMPYELAQHRKEGFLETVNIEEMHEKHIILKHVYDSYLTRYVTLAALSVEQFLGLNDLERLAHVYACHKLKWQERLAWMNSVIRYIELDREPPMWNMDLYAWAKKVKADIKNGSVLFREELAKTDAELQPILVAV